MPSVNISPGNMKKFLDLVSLDSFISPHPGKINDLNALASIFSISCVNEKENKQKHIIYFLINILFIIKIPKKCTQHN